MPAWTEEQVSILKEYCAATAPITAKEIGKAIVQRLNLPHQLTRSAVVCQAHRLGIRLPVAPLPRRGKGPSRAPIRDDDSPRIHIRPTPKIYDEPKPLPRERQQILADSGGPGVLLLNAARGDCRRPLDGTSGLSLRVCGEPVMIGNSYCDECHSRMYRQVRLCDLEAYFKNSI